MRARALLSLLTAVFAASTISHAEKSKFYYMDSLCKDHFLQRQYRKLDGGVLWSRNERNLDCTVTFQTHSILQRFMLHFDLLQLDCNDHLYVYDGAHATAPPKADLSCRNTKQQVGALFTRSNFVTLKYVTDNWGTDANGFKLVITAVKDPKHGCKEFRCKQREFCVSADLTCDGVDHCADGSDEDTASLCPDSGGAGASGAWLVLGAAGAALAALAAAVTLCCLCRRRAGSQRTHLHLQQMASSNGAGGAPAAGACKPATSPSGSTRLPGNWALPAGPRGYSAARPGRLRARAQR
ncbi:low-density lipoprotein receptor domain containing lost and found [Aphomia sociella]